MSARHLASVLHDVPAVQHALAYGSGVFSQPGLYKNATRSSAMLDFIFLVDDAQAWHAEVWQSAHRGRSLHGYALLV